MNILVTGGTGFLGSHLTRALVADGHHVQILGRNFAHVQELLSAGTQPIKSDLRDRETIAAACARVDAVYHVGALSTDWGKPSDFYAINVGGTEAIIEGCLRHNVQRLIHISSPSVIFDGYDHENVTETKPYASRFLSDYAWTKKLAEDRVNAASERGLQTVIIRPKAIFGPGDRTLLPRLIKTARQGRLPQFGTGQNLVDLTYVDNVVQALRLCLDIRAAIGRTYFVTNDEHILLWKVIRELLQQVGLSPNLPTIPTPVAQTIALFMEKWATITHRTPLLTRYSIAVLTCTQTYDISAARTDLGYTPHISVEEGIKRTIEALDAMTL
ncbi:NAD-dependent epimerase/dehydratase family protein [Chloroflexi bacterium TSY]|nr:NAD-dependent epimerase/dehydratase family protein [Chloroflexi bacterium TSY]